jgi:hypothetical protein
MDISRALAELNTQIYLQDVMFSIRQKNMLAYVHQLIGEAKDKHTINFLEPLLLADVDANNMVIFG